MKNRIFAKHDKIKTEDGKFSCICQDEELAVFAPVIQKREGGTRIRYKNIFVVGNDAKNNANKAFEFDRI